MKIVARLIYYKAVRPSFDIIEMDDATWKKFLHSRSNRQRIRLICALLGNELHEQYVRELAWIPLDDGMTVVKK